MRLKPRNTLAHSTNSLLQSVDLVGETPTAPITPAPSRINFVAFHGEFGSARLSAPAWNTRETPPPIERPRHHIEAATGRTKTPLVPVELTAHRMNSASADLSLAPLDLKTLPIQVQSPRHEVTRATDRRKFGEIAIKTTTLDAHSAIAVIADIEVEVVAPILDTRLASYRIRLRRVERKGAPSRVASAPDQTKSSQDKIKRAADRMNVAADHMKSTPIGLASAGFGLGDDLISSGVTPDCFAPVLMRNGVDLAYVTADPILNSAVLNHDSHRF